MTFTSTDYITCSCIRLHLVGMSSTAQLQHDQQTNFNDFVEDLRIDLGLTNCPQNEYEDLPLPTQVPKTTKKIKCSHKKRKVVKKLSTSCQASTVESSTRPQDSTQKIVRNLVIKERAIIPAYSAKFVKTNFVLTDENQGGERYHAVSADTDWLSKATHHLILCRAGVISPSSRGPLHVELFNMQSQSLTIAEFSSVAKLITHHYDY